MGRPPCCDKANVKRGLWTAEEDAKILAYVANHGVGNWTLVPQKAGLNRCGKSCRLRWTNYLRPDLKHDNFTPQEEQLILDLHEAIGSRWSLIAKQLPGRTDNDVKNYWNTKLRKKLSKMGIDPVTHKPFSRILSDYGNISGLPNSRINQIGPYYNNPLNIPTSKPGPYPVSTGLSNTIIEQVLQPHLFNEISSSASSSSSCSTVTQMGSSSPSRVQITHPFSSGWSTEFLLGDPFVINGIEEYNFQDMLSSGSELQNENGIDGSGQTNKQCPEAASSSSNSFLEAMFDKDCEMQMEFPEIFSLLSS